MYFINKKVKTNLSFNPESFADLSEDDLCTV